MAAGLAGRSALLPQSPFPSYESAATMSGKNRGQGRDGAGTGAVSCMAATIVAAVVLLVVASALLFLLSPPRPGTAPAGGGGGDKGPPREPVELAIGIAGHERWLDALRAWAKLACFKLRPAEPRYGVLRSPASVKTAAKESLEMGKETVKQSAESAARATEEALERTREKVKRKVSARPSDGDL